jgi:hypothetical protein
MAPRPLYLGKGLMDLQAKATLGNTCSFAAKALCASRWDRGVWGLFDRFSVAARSC